MFRPKMSTLRHTKKNKKHTTLFENALKFAENPEFNEIKNFQAFKLSYLSVIKIVYGWLSMWVWFYLCETRSQSAKCQSQSVNESYGSSQQ